MGINMPIYPSTYFTDYYRIRGALLATVLYIEGYDGANDIYLSDSIALSEAHPTHMIYPALKSHSGIGYEFNWFSKRWNISPVTFTLRNIKITQSETLAELLSDIGGCSVEVRLYAFKEPGDFYDPSTSAATLYSGIVTGDVSYGIDTISFQSISKIHKYNFNLPNRYIGDEYSDATISNKKKKIPILYGEFTGVNNTDPFLLEDGLGLAVAVPINAATPPEIVFADHECNAFTSVHIIENGLTIAPISITATFDLVDTDHTSSSVNFSTAIFDEQFYAFINFVDCRTLYEPYSTQSNYPNLYDGDQATYVTIYDNALDDGTNVAGEVFYLIQDADWFNQALPKSESNPELEEVIDQLYLQYNYLSLMSGGGTGKYYFYSIPNGTSWTYEITMTSQSATSYITSSVINLSYLTDKNFDLGRFKLANNNPLDTDSTLNNCPLGRIKEARLKARFTAHDFDNIFVAAKGREFGSWIEEQTSSNYSTGDLIEDPVQIIQSILRDIVGLAGSEIDRPSFQNAENTSLKMRINFHDKNEMTVFDAIQQICEQAPIAFVFHPHGVAGVIEMDSLAAQASASTVVTWSMIKDNEFAVRKTGADTLVNKLNVSSIYQEENGDFHAFTTYENSASQSNYGSTNTFDVEWPNITGATAQYMAYHLIKDKDGTSGENDGLWANRHIEIEFTVIGFYAALVLVGETIFIDPESVDPIILCYGESWSGKRFKITKKIQYLDRTIIRAIELFDTY